MSIVMKFVQKRGLDEQGKPVTQDYGACAECGHQFTEQEYYDRHSHSEEEYCPECCPACNDEKRIVELEKQITALKTALEFYANPATYKHVMTERGIEIPIINDNGEIARAALDGWSSGMAEQALKAIGAI